MNCQEIQTQLVLFVLNELSAEESSAIESHLRTGCESCNRHLREICEGVDLLFEVAPQSAVSQERVAAILQRASEVQDSDAQMCASNESSWGYSVGPSVSKAPASTPSSEFRDEVDGGARGGSPVGGSVSLSGRRARLQRRWSGLLYGLASLAAGVCFAAWLFPGSNPISVPNNIPQHSTLQNSRQDLDRTDVELELPADSIAGQEFTHQLAGGEVTSERSGDEGDTDPDVRMNVERMLQPTHSRGAAFGFVPQDQRASKLSHSIQHIMLVSSEAEEQKIDGRVVAVGDQITRQLHVFGKGLSQPPEQMDYVLFGESEQGSVALATISVDRKGTFQAVVDLPPVPLSGIFLRLEPSN